MAAMSERFEMRVDDETLARVDAWRATQAGLPSRAEAMRRLVEIGLDKSKAETVTFTDGEKLLITMMRDVYKTLKIKGDIDPDFVGEVISGGHYWAPKRALQGLFHNYQDDPRDVHFVGDVLDMWDFLENAYSKLSRKEKDRVAAEAEPFGKNVKFRGFDGNYETSHMGIAHFLVNRMDRWRIFKGREFNSHCPMVATYRRMLSIFAPIRNQFGSGNLSADEVIRILKAMKSDE